MQNKKSMLQLWLARRDVADMLHAAAVAKWVSKNMTAADLITAGFSQI